MAFCNRIGGECPYPQVYEDITGNNLLTVLNTPDIVEDILEIPRRNHDKIGEWCSEATDEFKDQHHVTLPQSVCGIAAAAMTGYVGRRVQNA